MSRSLLWADLSASDVADVQAARDSTEARWILSRIMDMGNQPSAKEKVLLEFYQNNLRFASECKFTAEKTSALFSILKKNHEEMVRGYFTLEQSTQCFRQLLLLHAVQRPPYSVGIFTFKDVSLITDYVNQTYYKKFKLFQYCFTQRHELVFTSRSNLAQTPPSGFAPLMEAIPAMVPEAAPNPAPAADTERDAGEAADPDGEDLDIDMPAEMTAVIARKIQEELRRLRADMEKSHEERERRLLAKIDDLESKLPHGKK